MIHIEEVADHHFMYRMMDLVAHKHVCLAHNIVVSHWYGFLIWKHNVIHIKEVVDHHFMYRMMDLVAHQDMDAWPIRYAGQVSL